MDRKYKTEEEMMDLVRSFEDATISHEAWKHAEHLTVAMYYLSHHDLESATEKMRSGILNLLEKGFQVDLTKEMPYHETLTIFWMRTVADHNTACGSVSILDKANDLVAKYDKDYPLKFYSRELLFSDEARANFVEGDLN